MISDLIKALREAKVDLDTRELQETLWLARRLTPARDEQTFSEAAAGNPTRPEPKPHTREKPSGPAGPELHAPITLPALDDLTSSSEKEGASVSIPIPRVSALPNALELGRALRPLGRRVLAHDRLELDEIATAERVAEQGVWLPYLRPARTRWLEVALVFDQGSSMAMWHPLGTELELLLQRQGAFRDVRSWSLRVDGRSGEARLFPGSILNAKHGQPRAFEDLLDPRGQRLILVVSDGSSPAWQSGLLPQLLDLWGRRGPVAVVQLLPKAVWQRTALRREAPARILAALPGAANLHLGAIPEGDLVPEDATNRVAVPVVNLEKASIQRWARMVAGGPQAWSQGVLLRPPSVLAASRSSNLRPPSARPENALELFQRFRSSASPTAQALAEALACVPLNLPVMYLLQQSVVPGAQPVHLAEVFLSNLLKPLTPEETAPSPDRVEYDFQEGVRELLLDRVPVSYSIDMLRRVAEFIEPRLGQAFDFPALLREPTSQTANEKIPRQFASVTALVLRRLGGDFAKLADRLKRLETQEPSAKKRGASRPAAKKVGSSVRKEPSVTKRERTELRWPEESGVQLAHAQGIRGGGVMLGVLATGVDADHPEHVGKNIAFRYVSLFPNSPDSPARDMRGFDPDGHGTHICGIAAGKFVGVAPEVDLYVASVLEPQPVRTSLGRVAAGAEWLLHQFLLPENRRRPAIVLISLGFPTTPPSGLSELDYQINLRSLQTLMRRLLNANVLPVVGVGNRGPTGVGYPAGFPECLAVGAVDYDLQVARFSGGGVHGKRRVPDVMGYGVNVYSATERKSDGQAFYERMSGTSMAAAYVAGIAALYRCRDPEMTALETRNLIMANAIPLPRASVKRAGKGLAVFR